MRIGLSWVAGFTLGAAIVVSWIITLSGQRISDYRDPALTYDEGWTILFNGKDLTG